MSACRSRLTSPNVFGDNDNDVSRRCTEAHIHVYIDSTAKAPASVFISLALDSLLPTAAAGGVGVGKSLEPRA